jgi:hypothetical protein
MLDISFDQSQFARTEKHLDRIDDRILTIYSERKALGQITGISPAVVTVVS